MIVSRICFLLPVFLLIKTSNMAAQVPSLFDAIQSNNTMEAKRLLQQGSNPNAYDSDSDNVLINAAIYASADCMKLLLDHKANPNLTNRYGQTPLMLCTDDMNKMKVLLEYGANINATAKSGNTALLIACLGYGKHELIKWMLAHGADVTAKRWNAETALMRAAQFSDTMTIDILLRAGLDINAHPWGFTPLMYAVRTGNWDAVLYLVAHGADVNIPDGDNNLPVAWAAAAGHEAAVKMILAGTKNINAINERAGMTALMWATYNEYDNPGIIQAFLDRGADVHIKAKDSSTALTWALKKGNTKTVGLLKKAGAGDLKLK